MKEAIGTFVIESFEAINETCDDIMVRKSTTLKTYIEYKCTVTGDTYLRIDMTSVGVSSDPEKALKDAIQNFLNGKVEMRRRTYDRAERISNHTGKIQRMIIEIPGEVAKDFFEKLFDINNWKIEPNQLK